MEKETELKVYQAKLCCDECGEEMIRDGGMLTCNPPLYPHKCKNGHYTRAKFAYPRIVYKEEK